MSASAPSSHDLSLAAFTINTAESNFRHTHHGTQSTCDDAAIDPVAIADEVARSFIPGKCLRDLTSNPDTRHSFDAKDVKALLEAERMDHCVCRKLDSAILMVKAAKDRS